MFAIRYSWSPVRRIATVLLLMCLAGVVAVACACCWPVLTRRTEIVVHDWRGSGETGTLDLRAPPELVPVWFDGPLTHLERLTPRREWRFLFTDVFGRARAIHVPPGLYAFTRGEGTSANVEAIGIEVLPGQAQRVTLGRTRPTPVTVHGQVRAESLNGEEITVRAVQPRWPFIEEEFEAAAEKDGSFRLDMPEVGDGEIGVTLRTPKGQPERSACIGFRRRLGGSEPLVLECPPGTVLGTVLDEHGRPDRGANLHLEWEQPGPEATSWPISYWTQADENGRFQFSHVFRGPFVLVVEGPWNQNSEFRIPMRFDGSLQDDRLDFGTLRTEVAGRLRVTRNIPPPWVEDHGVEVQARRAGDLRGVPFSVGRFEQHSGVTEFTLQPGRYEVWCVLPDGSRLVASANVSQASLAEVSLQESPGAWLDVRADDRAGQPIAFRLAVFDGQGRLEGTDRAVRFASFAHAAINLSTGAHELLAWDVSGQVARQTVEIHAREHLELRLRFGL